MVQAAAGNGLSFDPLPFEQDRLTTAEVDVGWGEVAQALMSAGMIVVLHKGTNLRLQSAGEIVVPQQDAVLERLMPALDLALRRAGCSEALFSLTRSFRSLRNDGDAVHEVRLGSCRWMPTRPDTGAPSQRSTCSRLQG